MEAGAQLLIVDDQEGIRELLSDACTMMGYQVATAASGTEALNKVKNENYDVIFVDMKMPGLDGLSTIKQILQIRPEAKAFLMTGFGEKKIMDDALSCGVKGIIFKPFDLNQIREMLKNF